MSAAFEELDFAQTRLGELVLRRRRPVGSPDQWIYEVRLGNRFLMSSLVHQSECELARRGLGRIDGCSLTVLVGGLGLGCTAAEVLTDPRVVRLDVVERLPEVIAWHRRGLVPQAATLCGDPRCHLLEGDCLELLQSDPQRTYDAVLLDIDDAPDDLLDDAHAGFYGEAGLRRAHGWLRPGGILALWTNAPPNAAVTDRLATIFDRVAAEAIEFANPLLEETEVNTLYFAHRD